MCLQVCVRASVMVKVDEGRDGDDVGDWHGINTRAGVMGDEGRVMIHLPLVAVCLLGRFALDVMGTRVMGDKGDDGA